MFGYSDAVAQRMHQDEQRREPGHSGIGTTLSANPLALAALLAGLTQLMTPANYAWMDDLAARLALRIERALVAHRLTWHVARVGARLEFGRGAPPRNGSESIAAVDRALEGTMHLFLLNRGCLLTPFHNMMLVSPATTPAQIERFLAVFDDCLDEFGALMRAE